MRARPPSTPGTSSERSRLRGSRRSDRLFVPASQTDAGPFAEGRLGRVVPDEAAVHPVGARRPTAYGEQVFGAPPAGCGLSTRPPALRVQPDHPPRMSSATRSRQTSNSARQVELDSIWLMNAGPPFGNESPQKGQVPGSRQTGRPVSERAAIVTGLPGPRCTPLPVHRTEPRPIWSHVRNSWR